jgi:hypothetical protein
MEDVVIFYGYLVYLRPFRIFCGNLVYFNPFGKLYQETSGKPARKLRLFEGRISIFTLRQFFSTETDSYRRLFCLTADSVTAESCSDAGVAWKSYQYYKSN